MHRQFVGFGQMSEGDWVLRNSGDLPLLRYPFLITYRQHIIMKEAVVPTIKSSKYPVPKYWEELEDICCSLYSELYPAAVVERYARNGQPQHGVDVFVMAKDKSELIGIAVRDKDRITPDELEAEYRKTSGFEMTLTSFVMVTSAPRDGDVQAKALRLSNDGAYPCIVRAWQDICELFGKHPAVVKEHFAEFFAVRVHNAAGTVVELDFPESHCELLITKLGDGHEHYKDMYFLGDLLNRTCIPFRHPVHYARLQEAGLGLYESYHIAEWINGLQDIDAILGKDSQEEHYALSKRQENDYWEHVASLREKHD